MENKVDINRLTKVSKYARENSISVTWVHTLVARGDIKSVKIDGVTFIKREV